MEPKGSKSGRHDAVPTIQADRAKTIMTRRTGKTQVLAVMYHYVRNREPTLSGGLGALCPDEFRSQLDELCRHLEPTDWPSFYGWTQGRVDLPERCFLLTFDDGLSDHARLVLPILQERRLRAVFFVPTKVLTCEHMLSAHAIHLLLARLGDDRFREYLLAALNAHDAGVDWQKAMDTDAALELYTYESEQRAKIKYFLTVTLPIDLRQGVIETLFTEHVGSTQRWSRDWYLGWNDVIKLQSLGHTIGGHGHDHEPYTSATPLDVQADIRHSADVLNTGLGPDIRPFSYPYGRYDDNTMASCAGAGFAACFTTKSDWIRPGSDLLQLPRVDAIDVRTVLEREFSCQQV